jgi:hypothetical protein
MQDKAKMSDEKFSENLRWVESKDNIKNVV